MIALGTKDNKITVKIKYDEQAWTPLKGLSPPLISLFPETESKRQVIIIW